MKTLKLNLLEKKEMNTVRGGYIYSPCGCHCYGNDSAPKETEDVADGDKPGYVTGSTSLHNETNYINEVPVVKKK